jgi:hypothetical protein
MLRASLYVIQQILSQGKLGLMLYWMMAGCGLAIESHAASLPSARTDPARDFTLTSVTLAARVITGPPAEPSAASYWFEWGTNQSYGQYSSPTVISNTSRLVYQSLSNLANDTWYHYRIVASNETGVAYGSNLTFRLSFFTFLRLPLAPPWRGSIAWGDFDADGDLDLAWGQYGHGPSFDGGILRNDANTFVRVTNLPSNVYTHVVWADYDNDGDIDLVNAVSGNWTTFISSANGVFHVSPSVLGAAYRPALAFGDYDNDGDLDAFLSSEKLFDNIGGSFSNSAVADALLMPNIRGATWIDFNNDGFLDISINGDDPFVRLKGFELWSNTNGVFTRVDAGLSNIVAEASAWADFDNDGDDDVLIIGALAGTPFADVFRNDGGSFSRLNAGFPYVRYSSAAWGDFDNDGDADLLLSGQLETPPTAVPLLRAYRNDGGTFTDIVANFDGIYDGEVQWGDYDRDGDLDITAIGYGPNAWIHRNDITKSNSPPSSPSGLSARVVGNSIVFSWNAAADAETPTKALTYNLSVGTTFDRSEVLSPQSILATGWRLIPARGNAGSRLSHTLTNLTPGAAYYYSVQAVDAGFAGSAFSDRHAITLPPLIKDIARASEGVLLGGRGVPGHSYEVLVSDDAKTWNWSATVTVSTNGLWDFVDPMGTSASSRFYKLRLPN